MRNARRLTNISWLLARPSIVVLALLLVAVNTMLGAFVVHGLHGAFVQMRDAEAAIASLARLRRDADEAANAAPGQQEQGRRSDEIQTRLAAEMLRLRALTADLPDQQRRLDSLQQSLGRPSAGPAIQGLLDALQQAEQAQADGRFAVAEYRVDRLFAISELRTLATIGLILLLVLLVWRDRRVRAAMAAERGAALAEADRALSQEAAERRQAEQALHRRDLMLRGLMDAMPQMVFVLYRDASGAFLNRRWHDYTGAGDRFSRDVGWDLVHPDDAPAVTARWRQAMHDTAPFTAEFRLRGQDGGYRWFLLQSVAIVDPDDGQAVRWVGALTDIEDIRRADAALRKSEDRFRRIFAGSPFGITLSEGDERRILQANPAFCQMLGYTQEELIGRSLLDITHPEERRRDRAFPRLEGAGSGWRMREKRYLTRQGMAVWARVRVSVFDAREGSVPQLLAVVEDISRQRELDEALRQAQRMEAVGQLSGGLAHDFNNLLGVIIGNVECLLETMADDPERAGLANEVLESALGGAELTRRLLAFGRRQSLSPQHIDLGAQAAKHVTLLSRTLGRPIRIETVLAEALWPVRADPSQIGDALLNLAINARDAMPHGGVLTIETRNERILPGDAAGDGDAAPGDYAVLAVSDTGIGMPPDVRARAAEPFFTTKPPGAGSGLGLSMVYGFVRQSGGHLTISSEVGIGTTVAIHLPRVAGDGAGGPRAVTPTDLPTGQATILVVNDSPEMRQVAERHLRHLGYAVLSAENGPAALDLLETGQAVDLLFTDIAMPEGLTGFQLAEAARALRPRLKVLFTTGYAGVSEPSGAVDWQDRLVLKPYRRPELAERVRAALSA